MLKKLFSIMSLMALIAIMTTTVFANESFVSTDIGADTVNLESLSNDELSDLFAPFQAIVDNLNAQHGTEIMTPQVNDVDGRYYIIGILSSTTLDEFKLEMMDFVNLLQTLDEWNAVAESLSYSLQYASNTNDTDTIDIIRDIHYTISLSPQVLSQVYELIDEVDDIIDIVHFIDITEYQGIDPLQTTAQTRTMNMSRSSWNSLHVTIAAVQVLNVNWQRWEFVPTANVLAGAWVDAWAPQRFIVSSNVRISHNAHSLELETRGQHSPTQNGTWANVTFRTTFFV